MNPFIRSYSYLSRRRWLAWTLWLVVVAVSALGMAVFTWLSEKKGLRWLDNFSIAASMLCGMLAAVLVGQ